MASVAEIEAEFLKVMPRYRWTADEAVERALQAGANLKGKHVIVTGATSGIGIPSALALAKTGCHLTVTARDAKKAGELEGQYKAVAEAAGGSARFAALDLTSYASVKAFAREWGQKPVEVLLHNAGVMAQPLTFTGDGEELQLHTNVLSVVLLTELLRPLLTDTARVVILSSGAHRRIPADVDFLGIFRYYLKGVHEDASKYEKWTSYATTKSLEIMYANALTEEFIAEGKGTRAVAVHPGVIPTGLATHLSEQELGMFAWKTADGSINPHFKTVEQGAATSAWACTSPELNGVGGVYLENCSVTPKDQISNGVPTWAAPDAKLVSGTKPHVWKLDDCRTVTSELRQHLASKRQLL